MGGRRQQRTPLQCLRQSKLDLLRNGKSGLVIPAMRRTGTLRGVVFSVMETIVEHGMYVALVVGARPQSMDHSPFLDYPQHPAKDHGGIRSWMISCKLSCTGLLGWHVHTVPPVMEPDDRLICMCTKRML